MQEQEQFVWWCFLNHGVKKASVMLWSPTEARINRCAIEIHTIQQAQVKALILTPSSQPKKKTEQAIKNSSMSLSCFRSGNHVRATWFTLSSTQKSLKFPQHTCGDPPAKKASQEEKQKQNVKSNKVLNCMVWLGNVDCQTSRFKTVWSLSVIKAISTTFNSLLT